MLREGGKLILVAHIRSAARAIYWIQKAIEFFSRRLEGEHMTSRPLEHVKAEGIEPGVVAEMIARRMG